MTPTTRNLLGYSARNKNPRSQIITTISLVKSYTTGISSTRSIPGPKYSIQNNIYIKHVSRSSNRQKIHLGMFKTEIGSKLVFLEKLRLVKKARKIIPLLFQKKIGFELFLKEPRYFSRSNGTRFV